MPSFVKLSVNQKDSFYDNFYNIFIWNTAMNIKQSNNHRNGTALTFVKETKIKFSVRVSGIPVNILSSFNKCMFFILKKG